MRFSRERAWSTSCSQNCDATELGVITKRNASEPSMAVRRAAGKTSASAMPSVSIQTVLPRLSMDAAIRWTKSVSRRE